MSQQLFWFFQTGNNVTRSPGTLVGSTYPHFPFRVHISVNHITALQDIHKIGVGLNLSLLFDALIKYLNQELLIS